MFPPWLQPLITFSSPSTAATSSWWPSSPQRVSSYEMWLKRMANTNTKKGILIKMCASLFNELRKSVFEHSVLKSLPNVRWKTKFMNLSYISNLFFSFSSLCRRISASSCRHFGRLLQRMLRVDDQGQLSRCLRAARWDVGQRVFEVFFNYFIDRDCFCN